MVLLSREEWLFTILSILIVTGYTYTLDWPQALETPLRQSPYYFTTFEFNMLYFAALLPVGLLGIAIGMVIDKIALPVSIVVITMIGFVAQLTIAVCFLTMFSGFYAVILILRALFGLTGEGAYTIQAVVIQKLGGENYDVMMGLCLTIPLFFDALNSLVTTTLYDATQQAAVPLFVCAGMCFLSVVVGVILIWKVRQQGKHQKATPAHEQEQFSCQHVKRFGLWFWLLIVLIFLCECALGPFLDNATDLLVKRFNFSYVVAGRLMMIPFGMTPVMSLVWSKLIINRHPSKRRLSFVVIGIVSLLPHLIMYLMPNNSPDAIPSPFQYVLVIFSLLLFSFAFAGFCSVMIPSVALLADEKAIGTAFSAVGSASSLGQAFMPIFNALVIDEGDLLANNYQQLSLLYGCLAVATILLAVLMSLSKSEKMLRIDGCQDELKLKLLTSTTSSFSGLQQDISLNINAEPDPEEHAT